MTCPTVRSQVELPIETPLPAEPVPIFDLYANLIREELDVPVALVSLVSEREQVFPGAVGLAEPWASERSTPLSYSFCQIGRASCREGVSMSVVAVAVKI